MQDRPDPERARPPWPASGTAGPGARDTADAERLAAAGGILVVDTRRAVVLAADATALRKLDIGGPDGGSHAHFPIALDAAMPAVASLRGCLAALGDGAAHKVWLTFWQRGEARTLAGLASRLRGAPDDVVSVRLVAEPAGDPGSAGDAGLGHDPHRTLAHEIRTPLAAIQALADALHGGHLGPLDAPRQQDYLASIRETARHALSVVQRLLEAEDGARARARAGDAAPQRDASIATDANGAVGEVIASLAALATGTGARLEAHLAPGLPCVAVGATELRQILFNLVANALAHGGAGVAVVVATAVEADGTGIRIEVADDGPGYPGGLGSHGLGGGASGGGDGGGGGGGEAGSPRAADQERSPGSQGSQGLGLAITRALAEAAGGRLELAGGRDGRGARARLVLHAAGDA